MYYKRVMATLNIFFIATSQSLASCISVKTKIREDTLLPLIYGQKDFSLCVRDNQYHTNLISYDKKRTPSKVFLKNRTALNLVSQGSRLMLHGKGCSHQ